MDVARERLENFKSRDGDLDTDPFLQASISVDVLYLGEYKHEAFVNANIALNHGNESTFASTFMDHIFVVGRFL